MKLVLTISRDPAPPGQLYVTSTDVAIKMLTIRPEEFDSVEAQPPFTAQDEHLLRSHLISGKPKQQIYAYVATGDAKLDDSIFDHLNHKCLEDVLVELNIVDQLTMIEYRKAFGANTAKMLLDNKVITSENLASAIVESRKSQISRVKNKLDLKVNMDDTKATWLIISLTLEGAVDLLEIISIAMRDQTKVILLAGKKGKPDITVRRAEDMGVRVVYSPVFIGEILSIVGA